jgi:hypothetical protein
MFWGEIKEDRGTVPGAFISVTRAIKYVRINCKHCVLVREYLTAYLYTITTRRCRPLVLIYR